jgi:ribonucleoside-diphosphate reductase alpha chain
MPISDTKAWAEMMLMLMNGCGVGFSVERQYINRLPEIPEDLDNNNYTLTFDDSKEGWSSGLLSIIDGMYSGEIFNYDLSELRPAGTRLKTFGGKSSGPEPLDQLLKFVIQVFKNAKGRKLNSLECHDICCYIANCVVSGGVRRSATISLSNLTDERLQAAKRGEFWRTHPFRSLSNNSVAYTEKPGSARFMREWVSLVESGSGERGIFNRESAEFVAMRSGRRSGGHEWGTNPCGRFDMRLLTTEGYKRFDELR